MTTFVPLGWSNGRSALLQMASSASIVLKSPSTPNIAASLERVAKIGYKYVQINYAAHYVYDEQNDIGFVNRDLYLFIDFFFKYIIGIDYPTSGIYHRKFFA